MRWQKPARLGLALIGIGCAVAVFKYSRKRPPATPVPAAITDAKVTSDQKDVVNFRANLNTGKEDLKIEASRQIAYEDNRVRYEHVRFTSTRRDGTIFVISADAAEARGKAVNADEPGMFTLNGHVHTKSSDGLEVFTEAATYDNIQGLATIPGKLTFSRNRMTGEGIGGTYDRQRDVLWLQNQARVRRAPDEHGQGLLEATAKAIGVARPDKYMNMVDHALIVQPDQTLAADNIIVHFSDDERGAKLIEMHANSHVAAGRSAKPDAPDLQADEIMLEFQPDGQTLRHATLAGKSRLVQTTEQGRQTISAANIDMVTGADGRTLTNLQAKTGVQVLLPASGDNPDRDIRAASLVTSGDEKVGLKAALFEGGVTFLEKMAARAARGGGPAQAAVDRTATSATLALDLKGGLSAIQSAEFRQNVNFKDGDMKAGGTDRAVHDEAHGTLELNPLKGAKAWVDDGSVRVESLWIQVDLSTHDLRAKDKVQAKMTQGKSNGTDAHTPALFDSAQPIFGTGAALKYVSASKGATFVGESAASPAVIYQNDGKNKISATDRLVLDQQTGNLYALGNVISKFQLEDSDSSSTTPAPSKAIAAPAAQGSATEKGPAPTPPTIVHAHEMTYIDADRQAKYVGDTKPVALSGSDGDVSARQIVLTLQKEQRALKTLDATGEMEAKFEGGRETIGDRLVYDAVSETHVITGLPLYFKSVQTDSGKPSCSLETSTELHYEGKDQTINEPASAPKALRSSTKLACDQPLRAALPPPIKAKATK